MVKSKVFKLVSSWKGERGSYLVCDRQDPNVVYAELFKMRNADSWRFILSNYPQNHSKMYGSAKAALAAIEREVL